MTMLAYAQARVQARAGALPTDAEWAKLRACSTLSQFLHVARGTGLGAWLGQIDERMDAHQLEAALRAEARRYVEEVATWVDEDWGPAVRWTAALVDLPAVRGLLGAGPVPAWIREDAVFSTLALADPDERRGALSSSGFSPLVVTEQVSLTGPWCAHFRGLWPSLSSADRDELERVIAICREHLAVMRDAQAGSDGWRLRERVARELARGFRRSTERPAVVFYHLAVVAGHWERLRGALVRRRLLPVTRSEHAWV